ncbi:MAG: RagB/SusD family nutrient uptake outer membrane protein [Bacteroidales bacterium]|nr:RagB/SusD family nutrient uptake outer membrane protein [Bacteroidales bacterium]
MKKKHSAYLLISSLFIILLTGCAEDFLEKPAGGAVTVDTIFNTKNQAQYAVASMYEASIQSYYVYSAGGQGHANSCARPGIITDEVYLQSNVRWIAQNIGIDAYYSGTMTAGATPDIPGFGPHFLGIRRANLVLKNIDKVTDASQAWKDDVRGQAIFCRALQHFELFRYYGGIPVIETVLGEDNLKISRSSVETVVNTIVGWCDEAAALLPESRPATEFGQVTRLSALALKSRVLLYAASPLFNTPPEMASKVIRFGDGRDSVLCYPNYDKNRWKLAADAAKDVLDNAAAAGVEIFDDHQPESTGDTRETIGNYEFVWNEYANKEIILANTQFTNNDWGQGLIWALTNQCRAGCSASGIGQWGPMNNVPVEFAMLYEKRDGTNWTVTPGDSGDDLATFLEGLDLDPRFYQSIAYGGMLYNSSYGRLEYYKAGDGISDGKLGGTDQDNYGFALEAYKFAPRIENAAISRISWPVFRLAEFYLNYAEALNEFEGPANAYEALNITRIRSGMPEKTGLSQEEFRLAVHNERTVELAFENHRYNDLLRWLKAEEALNKPFHGFKTTAKASGGTTAWHAYTVSLFETRAFPKKYYYLPFPNEEISKDYLGDEQTWDGQNPGW